MTKILFLSSANLTVNPRLLKEMRFAVSQKFEVDFVGFYLGNWSDEIDKRIVKEIDANFHYISVTRKNFFKWFFSSITEKIAQRLYPFFKKNLKINAYAHSKRSFLLNNYLIKNKKKYDIIIAHTLPTLFPAYKFAKKINTKFIFDIEDYHPGEATRDKNEQQRRTFLMRRILPQAYFITYASPLIGEYSLKLLDNFPDDKHFVVNNCFSKTEFVFKENNSEKIKFVWFSQNIAAGRGLELALPALEKFKDNVELHLIGNLYDDFYNDFLRRYSGFVVIHKPLPQKELHMKLSEFDVGLAIELRTADFNRQICLTNKIFAYAQAGLYILATDTLAQTKFLNEHQNIGIITEQNSDSFYKCIKEIKENIDEIRKNKKNRFLYAQKMAWEIESKKLLKIWK